MLVLSRKIREQIQIGNEVTITILRVNGNSVRIGIEAPTDVRILRAELSRVTPEESKTAATVDGSASDDSLLTDTGSVAERPGEAAASISSEQESAPSHPAVASELPDGHDPLADSMPLRIVLAQRQRRRRRAVLYPR